MNIDIKHVIDIQVKAVEQLINDPEGIKLFRESETYQLLNDPEASLLGESSYFIYNYFLKELKGVPRSER